MNNPLCIYHGNCADGFAAAWAVRQAFRPDYLEYHPGVHQTPPPDVTGRDVIMVDFSYKRPVLEDMAQHANSILILDHHKSAAEDLAPFIVSEEKATEWMWGDGDHSLVKKIAVFDMNRSGAGMAWDFFHDTTRPPLIDHIEDRDLWRFDLEYTREIQAAVFSYPYEFYVWDTLMRMDTDDLAAEGVAIERKHHKDIAELVSVCKRYMSIAGHIVPVASLPYTLTSDAGHLMCDQYGENGSKPEFAACYWDSADGRTFSLRSIGDFDVSEIATQYGGGGHRNAAGFKVPRDHELAKA